VPLAHVLGLAGLRPEARFVYVRSMDTMERSLSGGVRYWESHDLRDSLHPQTILAYGMNGGPLPERNGAPLRLRVERQLGYKMAKYLHAIEVVPDLTDAGSYWASKGYDWYAGI
jgi:DMSO/TMAO reductase YedYZ molybdopterin-dependent catalytic subunit